MKRVTLLKASAQVILNDTWMVSMASVIQKTLGASPGDSLRLALSESQGVGKLPDEGFQMHG